MNKSASTLKIMGLVITLILNTAPSHAWAQATAGTVSPLKLSTFQKRPKLVVVLVVDQLRSDFLTRFPNKFLPAIGANGKVGGYRYLMSEGAYFPFANFDILQSMTCPGHAMILTGASPRRMGIPLNEWYSTQESRNIYCTEDSKFSVVGNSEERGMSPKNLIGGTLTDEIKNASLPNRTIALALKDRSAIMLGGPQADLALWFDFKSFGWISSQFYLKSGKLPAWVESVNKDLTQRKGRPFEWKHGKVVVGDKESLFVPFGNEVTLDLALAALKEYKLGQTSGTDILAVGFSTHDMIGHQLGPNAPELEEMTLHEDRVLSTLFNAIRTTLPGGLKDVVLVLTADHGVAPATSFLKDKGLPSGTIPQKAVVEKLNQELEKSFGKSSEGPWIAAARALNFYLNPKALERAKLPKTTVLARAREVLQSTPGILEVYTDHEIRSWWGGLSPITVVRQAVKSFVPGASGDLIAIPKPFHYSEGLTTTHMTGYNYDTRVPLIFAGPRFKKGIYGQETQIVDIAPTLAFVLGVLPPATSEGRVLHEALAP